MNVVGSTLTQLGGKKQDTKAVAEKTLFSDIRKLFFDLNQLFGFLLLNLNSIWFGSYLDLAAQFNGSALSLFKDSQITEGVHNSVFDYSVGQ